MVAALGGALFFGNLLALARRGPDAREAARAAVARARPGSPVRGLGRARDGYHDLPQAPVGRTVAYMLIGFTVMVWGIATIVVA